MTLAQVNQILEKGGMIRPPPRAVVDQKSPDQIGLKRTTLTKTTLKVGVLFLKKF